ncbi:hypothetical protein Tco_1150421, partial [Tanacetum coccineum]
KNGIKRYSIVEFEERLERIVKFSIKNAKIKEECIENIQGIKTCIEKLNPGGYWSGNESTFKVLFGEEYDSFRERFVRVMDPLEIQLDKEEFHECDSKTCLAWLKKLFETSLYQKPAYYIRVQDFEYIAKRFQKYTGYSTQDFKDKIICYLNDIEKGIDARALHEESLRIKEKVIKERMESKRRVIEFEMMRLDKMIQKGECSSSAEDTNAKREKQSKKKCMIHL